MDAIAKADSCAGAGEDRSIGKKVSFGYGRGGDDSAGRRLKNRERGVVGG